MADAAVQLVVQPEPGAQSPVLSPSEWVAGATGGAGIRLAALPPPPRHAAAIEVPPLAVVPVLAAAVPAGTPVVSLPWAAVLSADVALVTAVVPACVSELYDDEDLAVRSVRRESERGLPDAQRRALPDARGRAPAVPS